MKLRSTHVTWLALALSTALAACQESYHEKDEHYILVAANVNLPYWQEADAGLRDVAKEMGLGVKATMEGPTSYSPKEEADAFQRPLFSEYCVLFYGSDRAK